MTGGRTRIGRITTRLSGAALALGLLTTGGANQAMASFGTPTYIIYVDGPNGGTIEASGNALPFPDDACGMRLTNSNILAWAWYSGYAEPTEAMDIENNGWMPPANQLLHLIEFTGPFGDSCDGDHVFHTPATPSSFAPPGAVALVVQFVHPEDVEFLDHNFGVLDQGLRARVVMRPRRRSPTRMCIADRESEISPPLAE